MQAAPSTSSRKLLQLSPNEEPMPTTTTTMVNPEVVDDAVSSEVCITGPARRGEGFHRGCMLHATHTACSPGAALHAADPRDLLYLLA